MIVKRVGLGLRMVPAVMLLVIALMVLTACASNPQKVWLNTCATYYQTLKGVNDALELQTITPDSAVAQSMKEVKVVLSPICRADAPPLTVDRASIQELLDAQLIKLIKIEKGIP